MLNRTMHRIASKEKKTCNTMQQYSTLEIVMRNTNAVNQRGPGGEVSFEESSRAVPPSLAGSPGWEREQLSGNSLYPSEASKLIPRRRAN